MLLVLFIRQRWCIFCFNRVLKRAHGLLSETGRHHTSFFPASLIFFFPAFVSLPRACDASVKLWQLHKHQVSGIHEPFARASSPMSRDGEHRKFAFGFVRTPELHASAGWCLQKWYSQAVSSRAVREASRSTMYTKKGQL